MSGSVEIPDAAVEVVAKELKPDLFAEEGLVPEVLRNSARWALRHEVRAALVAARPYLMPTREEIVIAIGDALWFEEHPERTGAEINNVAADAVLALLNGAES